MVHGGTALPRLKPRISVALAAELTHLLAPPIVLAVRPRSVSLEVRLHGNTGGEGAVRYVQVQHRVRLRSSYTSSGSG